MDQRSMMRRLWKQFEGNVDLVVSAYAHAEREGQVERRSNTHGVASHQYAQALLRDGLKKGWLEPGQLVERGAAEKRRKVAPEVVTSDLQDVSGSSSQVTADSAHYLQAVRDWRYAFRPRRVRVLLVAESHVASLEGDDQIQVVLPQQLEGIPLGLPQAFCRLVYCLGYGEDDICAPRSPVRNAGTRQYWDLLGAIASVFDPSISPMMPRRRDSNLMSRLRWKLGVLNTLSISGVWLEDASLQAMYVPGGVRALDGRAYRSILRDSFESAVWPAVSPEKPEQVWVIGTAVARALKGLSMIQLDRVISQPQDRDAIRYRSRLSTLTEAMRNLV